ncbi:transglycosylase SLT domain-containing protein [bacterium]|nr:transglycosylase SLT domain-containing protein [bacterium]
MKYLRYLLITLIVIIPSVITVLIYNDKITQNSPVFYKQGTDFYNNGDYQNAYYNYSKIKRISPLYSMALYKQAKSAQNLGDYSTAAMKYDLYLQKATTNIFNASARYNLAKSYFYLKKYDEAKEQFLIIKNEKKDKPLKEDYFLGLLFKKEDKNKAADYFRSYLDGVLTDKIEDKTCLLASAEELATLGINLNDNDKKLIGQAYFINKKYSASLEFFSKLPLSDYWDYIVLANHYAGNKVVAKKLIENGIVVYSSTSDTERLHKIYDIYTSYMSGVKVRNWTQMYKITQSNSLKGNDYVMYKLAGMLPKDKAVELYKSISEKYPYSDYAPESLWKVFWYEYYTKRNYAQAEKLAVKHIKQYTKVKSEPKMIFWLAKVQMKLNKVAEAQSTLSKLTSRFPDNYYGIRAEFILNKRNDFWATNLTDSISNKERIGFPISLSDIDIKDLKIINTIFSLGDYTVWLDADFNDNKIVESWFEARKGKKSSSVVLARDTIEQMEVKPLFISSAYKLAYPLYYINEINAASEKFRLDPYLIMALIREESYFNKNARSSTNAVGLMQLMPATANFIISKFSLKIPLDKDITDEKVNIYLGCIYLKYLKERFNNNDLYVIAAYNGGEGSVNRWLKTKNSDPDEFVENIPYDETNNYVKKIFKTYHLYRKIYK